MDWLEIIMYKGLVSAQAHHEESIQGLFKSIQDPQEGFNSRRNDQVSRHGNTF